MLPIIDGVVARSWCGKDVQTTEENPQEQKLRCPGHLGALTDCKFTHSCSTGSTGWHDPPRHSRGNGTNCKCFMPFSDAIEQKLGSPHIRRGVSTNTGALHK